MADSYQQQSKPGYGAGVMEPPPPYSLNPGPNPQPPPPPGFVASGGVYPQPRSNVYPPPPGMCVWNII